MYQLYELVIISNEIKEDLKASPYFNRIKDGVRVMAGSTEEARQEANKQHPMVDVYEVVPSMTIPEFTPILGKYPSLWLDESLTSCNLIDKE